MSHLCREKQRHREVQLAQEATQQQEGGWGLDSPEPSGAKAPVQVIASDLAGSSP